MRFYSMVIAGITAISMHVAHAASFPDVEPNHPNNNAIQYVQQQDIVSGYPDGTYRPDQTINRAEFTKIIAGAYGVQERERCQREWDLGNMFADVQASDWYAPFVCVANRHNVINGYPDGTFRGSALVNFAEAAKMLTFWYNLQEEVTDIWFERGVRALENRGAIPLSIRNFDQKITRGEMAEMIYRLDQNITNKPSQTYDGLQTSQHSCDVPVQYSYELVYNYKRGMYDEPFDAQIIQTNACTGDHTVLVASVKSALPLLQEKPNLTLSLFAEPATTHDLVFKTILADTDNPSGVLYRFNPFARQFTKMMVNGVYDGFFGGFAMAADEDRFVWVPNTNEQGLTQTMYVASLSRDRWEPLVQLSGNETFNGGGYALSSHFDVHLNGETVSYSVFDQSRKEAGNTPEEAFIATRTIPLPPNHEIGDSDFYPLSMEEISTNTYHADPSMVLHLIPGHMDFNRDEITLQVDPGQSVLHCAQIIGNTGVPPRTIAYQQIAGNESCMEQVSDHAAGNTYHNYHVEISTDQGLVTIDWTLHESNCGPLYSTMQEVQDCEARRAVVEESYDPLLVAQELLQLWLTEQALE